MVSPYQKRKAFFKKAANFKPWMSSGIFEAHIHRVPKKVSKIFIPTSGSPLNPAPEILTAYETEIEKCPRGFQESDKRPTAWAFARCEQRYKDQILNSPEAMAELKRLTATSNIEPVFLCSLAWSRPDYRFSLLEIVYDHIITTNKKEL